MNSAAIHVVAALDDALARFSFPILRIDPDYGSESINVCSTTTGSSARSPSPGHGPGNKNDGAPVERKNWTHVRVLAAYLRYVSAAELRLLNDIWTLDQRFTHLVCPREQLTAVARADRECDALHSSFLPDMPF